MVDTRQQAPVSWQTLDALVTALDDGPVSAGSVAEIVVTDPGLLARSLGLANSAYFAVPRTVTDPQLAVSLLGVEMIRTLAIGGVTGLLDSNGLPGIRDHAIEVASAARLLAGRANVRSSDAFTAGLLHDVGELLLWNQDRENYAPTRHFETEEQLRLEEEAYGTDHAVLGAEHLFEWRLPLEITDAVADHHDVHAGMEPLSLVVAAADELADGLFTNTTALFILDVSLDRAMALRAEMLEQSLELRTLLPG